MTEPLRQLTEPWKDGEEVDAPIDVYRCTVIQDWVDYNNHMTEAAYLTVFGWASDVLFQFIGVDDAYRAGGSSFYTVETHIIYEREAALSDSLKVTTQILDFDAKRLHFNHEMFNLETNERLSTCEQMLLHVDSKAAKASAIKPSVALALNALLSSHRILTTPPEVGRILKIKQKN
jgi:carnitine 3-dehydrogenase